jgi:hypothetical protein
MDDVFEMHEVVFEIYIEDKLTNRQAMQAPKQILITNFIETAKKIKNDRRPIRFKMIVPVVIWDDFEHKQKTLNNELEISNDAMIAWEESNKEAS